MENHELSKMHRKKIEELDSELLLEALAGDSDESISDNSADEVLSGTKVIIITHMNIKNYLMQYIRRLLSTTKIY